eukprot:Amastigsp_a180052_21.p5 type:complete len:104 gc:universal Amastigsp_a180052_21:1204-1515(+)
MSDLCLSDEFAAAKTYLMRPLTFSCHDAIQVLSSSCLISFHRCPSGGGGIGAPRERLSVISSGVTLGLSMPRLGCSPRPRNSPGGSIVKLPTCSLNPSMYTKP